MKIRIFFTIFLMLSAVWHPAAQRFFPDDPLEKDRDDLIPANPQRFKVSDYYDFLENTFSAPGDKNLKAAVNVNTLGEVPDSSWFTNRHGKSPMSIEDLVRGPDHIGPPVAPWHVIRNKVGGITPGFTITDSRNYTYQIKFDPLTNPEMATSAEVICTKFFHAFGYFVPENHIVSFSRDRLQIAPKARFTTPTGKVRPMTDSDLDAILTRAARDRQGNFRALASLYIPGKPMGEIKFYGTRPDDPNDTFPHEHRRELRGLRVFCAWLNHDDSRSVNTFDSLIEEGGRRFVRHYLYDFGSCLGSASVFAQKPRAGNEYLWELDPTLKTIFSLGLWVRPWAKVIYPEYPSIGRLEADFFRPELWRPEYPNAAFRRMDRADAFWAARIVMAFDDEMIRAIVRTGLLSDKSAEKYLADTLIRRRDKIGRHWLNQTNPCDRFLVSGGSLTFRNATLQSGVAEGEGKYEIQWFPFDNEGNTLLAAIAGPEMISGHRITIPESVFTGPESAGYRYATVQIRGKWEKYPDWDRPLQVTIRQKGGRCALVGIDGR